MTSESARVAEARRLDPSERMSEADSKARSVLEHAYAAIRTPGQSPRRLIAAVLVLGVLAAIVYVLSGHRTTSLTYRTAEVTKGAIASVISASGTLRPETQVSVVAQAPGQIAAVMVDFNSAVKAGDVLARLKSDVTEARLQIANADVEVARGAVDVARGGLQRAMRDVDSARANAVSAKADVGRADLSVGDANSDLKRKQELTRTGDVAKVEAERAKTAYSQAGVDLNSAKAHQTAAVAALASAEAAVTVADAQEKNAVASLAARQAALRQAQLDFEQTFIRAPIDGVVIDRNAIVGQAIGAGAGSPPMFIIANDLRQLEVHASIDEADIGRVTVGQAAKFGFDAFPGRQFAGKVVEIRKTPQVVQNVVSYDVVLSVANEDLKLLPGMTADVRIIAGARENVLKVPNAALRFHPAGTAEPAKGASGAQPADASTVWRLGSDGQPKPVAVYAGLSDGIETEVTSGDLSAGEKMIVGSTRVTTERASVGPLKF